MSATMSMSTLPGVGSPLRLAPVTNLERMYALDEAWNARDWDTFDAYHDHEDVVVFWPGREGAPTLGARITAPSPSGSVRRFRITRSSTRTTSCSVTGSTRPSSRPSPGRSLRRSSYRTGR
jgi:hypothetical protein